MKKQGIAFTLICSVFSLLTSCAQNEFGSIRMVLNSSQEQEVSIDNVDCFNVRYGDDNNGEIVNGMTCVLQFQNGTDLSNTITFNVYNLIWFAWHLLK